MTTQKYYSDDAIIAVLEIIKGEQLTGEIAMPRENVEVLQCAIERIKQKQKQIEFQGSRLRTAAECIGFNTIDELQSYE